MMTFEDLYEKHYQDVYRFAVWLTGSRAEADDVVSETFVRAWTGLGRIRTETLRGYLFQTARNVFLGRLRKQKRESALADAHSDPLPGPESTAEIRQTLAGVERILKRLPEADRSAFVLRVVHDLGYAEIARVLGISETAARVKVHRIRKRLIAWRNEMEA
jgi:RNA polymerase sigma-70 factor (ECF subfamily)